MNMLEKAIAEASQKYYTDGSSGLSDKEWDSMMDQLKKENPDSPLITQVGHGYDVNKDTTPGKKYKHKYGIIGSLEKCHNWSEVTKSIQDALMKRTVIGALKLDGLSIVMYFEHGFLYRALTRGKDNIGIDVTEKVGRILKNRSIKDKSFTGSVRGEAIMSYKNFELFKQVHPEAENPRNSVAGIINQKEITDDIEFVDIVVYTVIGDETRCIRGFDQHGYASMLNWLTSQFEHVVKYTLLVNIDDIKNKFDDAMKNLATLWYGYYPADGIVLTDGALQYDDNNHSYSFNSIAYKFPAETKEAEIEGVEWSFSKTGYMIPRVRIHPTSLSGATVRYASGFNAKYVIDNKIGPGAIVTICRSGEVIPDIQEVVKPSCDVTFPSICPHCNELLQWKGVHLMCTYPRCTQASVMNALIWMNMLAPTDGLGDTLKLKFLSDVLNDDISIENIYKHGPINYTSESVQFQKFITAFNSLFNKPVDLKTAIQACNIPRFGDVTAGKFAKYPEAIQKWLAIDCEVALTQIILQYTELGEADMNSLKENNWKLNQLHYIEDYIIWEPANSLSDSSVKVAITGKLSVSRAVFEKELQAHGFLPGNISRDTQYLITDSPNSASSKNKYADEHGITKISEEEFRAKFF